MLKKALDPRNHLGKQVGHLTLVKYIETLKSGRHVFECECECGTLINRTSQYLNAKRENASCGCQDYPELIGQKFGKLTVLKFIGYTKNNAQNYLCKCDCGNEHITSRKVLLNGSSTSCGCNTRLQLIGKKFGRLTVVEELPQGKNGLTRWRCECECGNTHDATGGHLTYGNIKSCGCLKVDRAIEQSKLNIKHDDSYSRLHGIWRKMRHRCSNENATGYQYYGGKGIKVCEEWEDYNNFKEWALTNGYQDDLTIDRIDGDKDYCPENCRWATRLEQNRNLSTTTKTEDGIAVNDLADRVGMPVSTVRSRLSRGVPLETALTLPLHYNTKKYNGKSLAQICRDYDMDYELVRSRLRKGWDIFKAIDTPPGNYTK